MANKIKPEITITYKVTLNTDVIGKELGEGRIDSLKDVKQDLERRGIGSGYVSDFEIDEVEDVSQ